jgi:hypothetical protein
MSPMYLSASAPVEIAVARTEHPKTINTFFDFITLLLKLFAKHTLADEVMLKY